MGRKSNRAYTESDSEETTVSSSSEYLPKRSKISTVNIRNYMKKKFRSKSLAVERTKSSTPTRSLPRVRYKLPSVINKYARDSSEDSDLDMFPMFPVGAPSPAARKHQDKYFVGTVPGSHSGPNGMCGGMVLYVRRNNYIPSRRDEEYRRSGPSPKDTKKRFSFQTLEDKAHSICRGWKKFM